MNKSIKKIALLSSIFLVFGTIFYLNNRFGLLSMAGLNGKGLSAKAVIGTLKSGHDISSIQIDHSEWTYLLKKYVEDNGIVDYRGFITDKEKLENYLNSLSEVVPEDTWSVKEQLAYYINLYNAHTVHLILVNYPVKSIKDIDGPWTTNFIKIGDKELSLGALEHSILRKMNEPRIHFAINCASISCPKLLNEAFTAANLDAQLTEVTQGFINSNKNTISHRKVELSSIFNWFKNDFFDGELIKYINQYSEVPIASSSKIGYKEYNWNLNGL